MSLVSLSTEITETNNSVDPESTSFPAASEATDAQDSVQAEPIDVAAEFAKASLLNGYVHSVGKRKSAVARVWIKPGEGKIVVNRRSLDEYLLRPTSKMVVHQPFALTEQEGNFDVLVNVCGGGLSGQADAIRHGIARALALALPQTRGTLKKAGLLRRDARKKERKLPGQPGARKRFQFSKR